MLVAFIEVTHFQDDTKLTCRDKAEMFFKAALNPTRILTTNDKLVLFNPMIIPDS